MLATLHQPTPPPSGSAPADQALMQTFDSSRLPSSWPAGGQRPSDAATPAAARYALIQLHAQGGLGRIYLAQDNALNRQVALKEIKPEHAGHAESWQRFVREAQVTGQLEHPNIVPVHELGLRPQDGQPFYTMRFMRGQTLRQAIADYHQRRRAGTADPLELPRLLGAFINVCEALGYAHARAVVHRDLKPDNVMLGSFGEVIVLDWGLAKLVGAAEEAPAETSPVAVTCQATIEATLAGSSLGTPGYMAPEQAAGRLDLLDARTDIYGLGAILFEIITGRPPHQGSTVGEVLERIIHGETPRARSVEPSAPAALDAVCARAMAKDHAYRYCRAVDLADEVRRFLADAPVAAYREPWGQRLARWARHHRTSTQAVAAVLLAITVVSVLATFLVNSARRAADAARRQEEEQRQQAQEAYQSAERARHEEEAQRRQAQQAQQNEKEARNRAETLARESHDRLVRHYVNEGGRLLEEGDLLGSLSWYALALKEDEGDRGRERVHRTRLAVVARDCPRLLQTLLPEGRVAYAEFSPDDRSVITASSNLARVWNAATGAPVSPSLRLAEAEQMASVTDCARYASFSPDGRRVVTACKIPGLLDVGSAESEIRLWNAATGKPLTSAVKIPGTVLLASFDWRGDRLVTAANIEKAGGEVRVWDAATLRPVCPPLKHRMRVTQAVFSPDGRRVLTTSWDGTAQVWDAATGKPVLPSPLRHKNSMYVLHGSFSPDGRQLVTSGNDSAARIWDAATGKPLGALQHSKPVWQAVFSPNGQQIVTAGWDHAARVWSWSNNQPLGLAMRHQDEVLQASFSPDGRHVLTVGKDRTVRVWEALTGQAITPPLRHTNAVTHAAFSHDGRRVLTASHDGTVRIWEVAPAKGRFPPLEYNEVGRQAVAISHDGLRLLTKSPVLTPEYSSVLAGTPAAAFPANFPWAALVRAYQPAAPDRKLYKAARVWDLTTGKALTPPLIHTLPLDSGEFSPDGRRVLLVSARDADKGRAWLWEVATGKLATPPLEHPGPMRYAAFSPDGRLVVTTSVSPSQARTLYLSSLLPGKQKGEARVWDAKTGRLVCPPLEQQAPIQFAAFSQDGLRLVTTAVLDPEEGIQVWDIATGRPAAPPPFDGPSLHHAAFSPDGRRLVTAANGGGNNRGQVWEVATATPVGPPLKHDGWVNHVAFSPDGRRVVTASRDGTARVWEASTGKPLTPALRHKHEVWYAAFSGDGRLVATAGFDGTARVWDAETGAPVGPPVKHPLTFVNRVWFSTDGRQLFTEVTNVPGGSFFESSPTNRQIWVSDLAPDNRPVQTVLLEAEWLAGHRVDATGSLAPLTWASATDHWGMLIDTRAGQWPLHYRRGRAHAELDHWKEAVADYTRAIELGATDWEVWFHRGQANNELKEWDRVIADHSKAIALGATHFQAWSQRAIAYRNSGQFEGVVADTTKLIQEQPYFWGGWAMRGDSYASLGQWDRAEADYAKAEELGAYPSFRYGHALVRLAVNDVPGYRRACDKLLRRYEQTPNRDPAFYAAWACVLIPDAVADAARPLQVAERALAQSPKTWAYLLVRGAALYRAGRLEEAVKQLQEALAARQAEQASGQRSDDKVRNPFLDCAYDLLLLTMAQQRLGNAHEARQALNQAIQWIEQPPPKTKVVGNHPAYSWGSRLTHQLLRREAEALLEHRKIENAALGLK
jgi:WD40 repeat protein/Flp pilus assembly protein TadD/type II secretory pathway pseudopilin PulG/tRNA A-37 threonylcarbamoyl transferase component Bud32